MSDIANFKPKTVYVIYIASTPAKVWEALTSSEFTRKYFWDLSIELEPKLGGDFALRMPDGTVNVQGKVIAWDPPRKFAVTWRSNGRLNSPSFPSAMSPTRSRRRATRCA